MATPLSSSTSCDGCQTDCDEVVIAVDVDEDATAFACTLRGNVGFKNLSSGSGFGGGELDIIEWRFLMLLA